MRLQELHEDIQICILNFLNPLDILVLRKTCKACCHATLQRTVWIKALQRVCARNFIFMPTFPMEDMSLLHLEYAAMGPENWSRLCTIRRDDDWALDLREIDLKKPHSVTCLHPDPHVNIIQEIFLVPGGRYLVTVIDNVLSVWDLGVPGSGLLNSTGTSAKEKPIATKSIGSYDDVLLVHSTSDGKGLLIFVGRPEDTSIFFVIYPTSQDPQLRKFAEFGLPAIPDTGSSFFAMTPNRLACLLEGNLVVYDHHTGATFSTDIDQGYHQVFFTGSAVIALYWEKIVIWPIPMTANGMSAGDTPTAAGSLRPFCSASSIPVESEKILKCRCICDWYTGTHRGLLFDLIDYFGCVHRLEVIISEDFGTATVTLLRRFPDQPLPVWELGRLCNDMVVTWARNRNHFVAGITGISSGVNKTVSLYSPVNSKDAYILSSLCPFSGRLVYVDKEVTIQVSNYFSPPLTQVGMSDS